MATNLHKKYSEEAIKKEKKIVTNFEISNNKIILILCSRSFF